jgi:hypothetical protein
MKDVITLSILASVIFITGNIIGDHFGYKRGLVIGSRKGFKRGIDVSRKAVK